MPGCWVAPHVVGRSEFSHWYKLKRQVMSTPHPIRRMGRRGYERESFRQPAYGVLAHRFRPKRLRVFASRLSRPCFETSTGRGEKA